MKLSILGRTLFLASMLVGTAALADPELRRCVDPVGHVTLTDEPCQSADQGGPQESAPAEAADAAAPSAADPDPDLDLAKTNQSVLRPRAPISPAAAARQSAWAQNAAALRGFSTDVETLKAARLNLQARDDVALAQRQHRLSGVN